MNANTSPSAGQLHHVRKRPRFQMGRTVFALMLREMATTYGRSVGGYLWAILDPVLGIALLSVVFSLALRKPPIGDNFALFYASGYLPFAMFNSLSQKIARSVNFSKPFMAYPCVSFIDMLAARLILNGLTDIIVFIVIVTGVFFIYGMPFWMDIGTLSLALGLGILLAAGVGTLNCFIMTSFPVYERVWSIATRPLFLISGVFFMFNSIPKAAQDVLWYNPLVHIVGMARQSLYPTYNGDYLSPGYVALIGSIALLFGLLLLVRHFKRLMES
ncbi:ABC transporter permease [Paracoccus acridae]|uniref:ABC transporter permease n=1 Tax=Paracoccus acridae TaxID=1795310 RepID=UPI001E2B0BAD|nr:ABC transporter permease [Paracoccus acridae]